MHVLCSLLAGDKLHIHANSYVWRMIRDPLHRTQGRRLDPALMAHQAPISPRLLNWYQYLSQGILALTRHIWQASESQCESQICIQTPRTKLKNEECVAHSSRN
ncbi:hypothetical protein KIN20_035901 [Parelaphostrongylus tenuis]|uniref:Uncharacterized protein n=1 Tax=Parelaphostrongylus tenuis TaxID=148309 RepID=A0AAD5WKU3_PARTN|nr:hypothetical protein KIN20_035901 [Parelaphostrongylus tenuis]